MKRPMVAAALLVALLAAPARIRAGQEKASRTPDAQLLEFLADFGSDEDQVWLDRALAQSGDEEQGNNEVNNDEDE